MIGRSAKVACAPPARATIFRAGASHPLLSSPEVGAAGSGSSRATRRASRAAIEPHGGKTGHPAASTQAASRPLATSIERASDTRNAAGENIGLRKSPCRRPWPHRPSKPAQNPSGARDAFPRWRPLADSLNLLPASASPGAGEPCRATLPEGRRRGNCRPVGALATTW
jgi:hypothetical protein